MLLMIKSGLLSAINSLLCVPVNTEIVQQPAFFPSSTSTLVSPTLTTDRGSFTPQNFIAEWIIAGWGLPCPTFSALQTKSTRLDQFKVCVIVSTTLCGKPLPTAILAPVDFNFWKTSVVPAISFLIDDKFWFRKNLKSSNKPSTLMLDELLFDPFNLCSSFKILWIASLFSIPRYLLTKLTSIL